MTLSKKIAAITGAVLLLLAIAAQLGVVSLYGSRLGSWTHNSEVVKERRGDLVSSVFIERPIWRWLPFVKVGDTIYRHSYQYSRDGRTVLERDSTTQTHLVVIGLSSERTYDELADAPFQSVHREYLSLPESNQSSEPRRQLALRLRSSLGCQLPSWLTCNIGQNL